MSSAAARTSRTPARGLSLPGRSAGRPATPPRLRVVAAPAQTRSLAGLVVVCATVLAAAMVGLLLLNVTLEQGAYELRQQQKAATRLTETRDALAEQLRTKSAPDALARQADKLGMVPGSGVAFLQTGNAAVIGQAAPARGVSTAAPTATPPVAPQAVAPSTGVRPSPATTPGGKTATAGKTATGKTATPGKTATAGKTATGKTATTGKPAATGAAPTKVSPSPKASGAAR